VEAALERSGETNGSAVSEFANRPKRVPSPKSYGRILSRLSVPKVWAESLPRCGDCAKVPGRARAIRDAFHSLLLTTGCDVRHTLGCDFRHLATVLHHSVWIGLYV